MRDYASLFARLLIDLGLSEAPDTLYSSDLGVDAAFRVSLASSFYKKLCPDGNSKVADAAALEKFRRINARLPESEFRFEASNEVESCFWDYFVDHFNQVVGPSEEVCNFDMEFIREHMMCGPGAAQKADSRTLVTKLFESSMTYTEEHLLRLYRGALVETGLWADAEMHRFQRFGVTKVRGGKLFFAPKNADISRTCCTEANLNMLIQQAIGAFYEVRLGHFFGISLKTQPDYNRELARVGSIDGSFGTVDKVSASDSIGLQLMLAAQRPSFLRGLTMLSRSERAVLPDGSEVELRMISTMGNGFTFPLQTVIFACVVKAVYDLMGIPMRAPDGSNNFGVFGDDVIVRAEAYEFYCRMCAKLGFEVNVGKSFNTGPFRESCGHDYYLGSNIRGVYVRSLEDSQQVYSLINRLHRWTADSGIRLPETLAVLLSWVKDIRVPPSEDDEAGIHVPFVLSRPKVTDEYWFKYRAHKRRTQRMQVLEADDPKTVNECGTGIGFLSGVYRRPDIPWNQANDPVWRLENAHRWTVSASLRDKIGSRARYKIVTRTIPWWDYLPYPKKEDVIQLWDPETLDEHSEYLEWRRPLTEASYAVWSSSVAGNVD